MPRMKQAPSTHGFIRCWCGYSFKMGFSDNCPACGLTVTDILDRRKRVCALNGCEKEFMPEYSAQKTCCEAHGVRYYNQRRRDHRAKQKNEVPRAVEISQTDAKAGAVGLGPAQPLNPPRKCHDCGATTRQYRCLSCSRKWRRKNGLDQDGFETFRRRATCDDMPM